MPFMGTLQGNQSFVLDVTPAVEASEATAVTVSYLNSSGNIRDIEILTAMNSQGTVSRVIPKNTVRIYIEINLPRDGLVQARVQQGATIHLTDLAFDGRLVFDVV
jgi:hypothetical protein